MLRPKLAAAILLATALAAAEASAIEMFTYFGDGSRIGLPSLEVPIEAYTGIPLRSDRIRARRRSPPVMPGTAVRGAQGTRVGNVTIRPMPTGQLPVLTEEQAVEAIPVPEPTRPAGRPATNEGRPADPRGGAAST